MVQRSSKEELKHHLQMLEEAKERDHRKIGKELELFTTSQKVGQGLPLWLPNGATIRRVIERYIVDNYHLAISTFIHQY